MLPTHTVSVPVCVYDSGVVTSNCTGHPTRMGTVLVLPGQYILAGVLTLFMLESAKPTESDRLYPCLGPVASIDSESIAREFSWISKSVCIIWRGWIILEFGVSGSG